MYFVYILECKDGTLYVGCTNNLKRRVLQHNSAKSGAHYTKIRRPVTLKYSETFSTLNEARGREAELKRWRREEKLALFQQVDVKDVERKRYTQDMKKHRIYTMSFASVYLLYIAKAKKKGRTKKEVDEVIRWLTGYSQKQLETHVKKETDFETFFAKAKLNPSRKLITGVVCGVRVEEVKEKTMREIRYLDKLVDELAKGKVMDKILRK